MNNEFKDLLKRVIYIYGTQAAAAKAIGITPVHLHRMLNSDDIKPNTRTLQMIAKASQNTITFHQLARCFKDIEISLDESTPSINKIREAFQNMCGVKYDYIEAMFEIYLLIYSEFDVTIESTGTEALEGEPFDIVYNITAEWNNGSLKSKYGFAIGCYFPKKGGVLPAKIITDVNELYKHNHDLAKELVDTTEAEDIDNTVCYMNYVIKNNYFNPVIFADSIIEANDINEKYINKEKLVNDITILSKELVAEYEKNRLKECKEDFEE